MPHSRRLTTTAEALQHQAVAHRPPRQAPTSLAAVKTNRSKLSTNLLSAVVMRAISNFV